MGKKKKKQSEVGKSKPRTRPYPFEFRKKIVQLYLEEGYSSQLLQEQFGLSSHSIQRWVKAYRSQGDEGLVAKLRTGTNHRGTGMILCVSFFLRYVNRSVCREKHA